MNRKLTIEELESLEPRQIILCYSYPDKEFLYSLEIINKKLSRNGWKYKVVKKGEGFIVNTFLTINWTFRRTDHIHNHNKQLKFYTHE